MPRKRIYANTTERVRAHRKRKAGVEASNCSCYRADQNVYACDHRDGCYAGSIRKPRIIRTALQEVNARPGDILVTDEIRLVQRLKRQARGEWLELCELCERLMGMVP